MRVRDESNTHTLTLRSGIPGIVLRGNYAELYGIPTDSGIAGTDSDSGIVGTDSDSGIPGTDSDSGIARNYREFLPIPEFRVLVPIPALHGIPTDFGIPDRNWIITRCRSHDRIILEIAIPESDGIPRNSHRFRFQPIPELMELIPRAELIPQCSTLRNRMTALSSSFRLREY
jgi:hypothetical protein